MGERGEVEVMVRGGEERGWRREEVGEREEMGMGGEIEEGDEGKGVEGEERR